MQPRKIHADPVAILPVGSGIEIVLYVQPRARRTEIVGAHAGTLRIKLAAPPVQGAANRALIAFLSRILKVPRRQIQLRTGARSRRKTVRIDGITASDLVARITGIRG